MTIDVKSHRLFLGADKLMVMLDYTTGKVVGSVPIGEGVDANSFDPATQLAFASCRDGTVTIAHEDAPDKLTVVQPLNTMAERIIARHFISSARLRWWLDRKPKP